MSMHPGDIATHRLPQPLEPGGMVGERNPRRKRLWIVLAGLIILALIGSALGAYLIFFKFHNASGSSSIIGHAYFTSSGLFPADLQQNQGIADQVHVKLENVPAPNSGKSYYAWLLNNKTLDWQPIALGRLTVDNGIANLFYGGDTLHTNLLANNSRFIVTEEDASVAPQLPSEDPEALRYYAAFSEVKPASAPYSLYEHIGHLLAADPKVKSTTGLAGGLDTWLYRNSEKILEWAGSARDTWSASMSPGAACFMFRQLTRIMYYLDGVQYAPLSIPVTPTALQCDLPESLDAIAKIGLLTPEPQVQNPPGYLYHIGVKHLHEMILLPDISSSQKTVAIQISQKLNIVTQWFQTIHSDIKALYAMSAEDLFGNKGRVTLNEVATLANDAFVGKVNAVGPTTDGVVQIHYALQNLATFDIRACSTDNACPKLV